MNIRRLLFSRVSSFAVLAASAGMMAACGNGSDSVAGPPPDCEADSAASSGLVINELLAKNAAGVSDGSGNRYDWVELYNSTDQDVSLCGWSMTTDLSDPAQVSIEHESTVPARGYLLLYLVGEDEAAGNGRVPLHLPRGGGELGIAGPGGDYSDRVVFGSQATDFSAARQPDAGGEWLIAWHVSPGEPNSDEEPATGHTEDPGAAPEQIPAAGDLTGVILGYDRFPEIEISIDEDGMDKLRDEPYEYVPGHLVYDGRRYGPVGVRLKGHNSFQPIDMKPSFRINIDEFVDPAKFFALDDLTLNNMTEDFSMMHERLAYMMAREMGPASRCNHALVTVNGEPYGLYANVETVKWHMLARWYDDSSGPLYEASDVDFKSEFIEDFEHESGDDDRQLLKDLADALDNSSADQAIADASELVDMESFWNYWAMSVIVGQFDAFPYSDPGDDYFVYIDPVTGKLSFLPWGMDETFYSSSFDVGLVSSILATQCMASDACYQSFVDHTWAALERMEAIGLAAERTRIAEQIAPYVAMDQRKPYDDAKVEEFQTQLRYFIEGRRAQLTEQLPPPSTQ